MSSQQRNEVRYEPPPRRLGNQTYETRNRQSYQPQVRDRRPTQCGRFDPKRS